MSQNISKCREGYWEGESTRLWQGREKPQGWGLPSTPSPLPRCHSAGDPLEFPFVDQLRPLGPLAKAEPTEAGGRLGALSESP